MKIELYKFITPPEHPDIKHLTYISQMINIPTEFVIHQAQIVTPDQARVYNTHLYWYEDEIFDYDGIRKAANGFKGTSHYDEVMLAEVWMDNGDDGHTAYSLQGWMYVPYSRLKKELEGHCWFREGGLPTCMSWGTDYEKRHEALCEQIERYD